MSTLLHDKQVNIWYLLTIIIFLKDFIKNKWTKLFFTQYHNTYFSARKNFQKKNMKHFQVSFFFLPLP